MEGKFITLYTLPTPLAGVEAPVLISKGELLMSRFSEKLFVRIEMHSLDEREVHSVKICLQLFDEVGAPIESPVQISYSSLSVKRDSNFGWRRIIPIPSRNARSFSVFLTNVTFSDYSFWDNDLPLNSIGKMQTLREALGSDAVAKQFEAQYGSDCQFMPSDETVIWYCTCGAVNRSDEERCHICRRKRTALCDVNFDALKVDLKNAGKAKESKSIEKRVNKDFRKRLFISVLIILPILLVSSLIVLTIPPFIERQKSYQRAEYLLEQNHFDEAQAGFLDLGDYRNSKLQVEKEIPYQKALFLLDAAQNADATAFSIVGVVNPVTGDDEEGIRISLVNYAREMLETIAPYKDAENLLDSIQKTNEEYTEKLNEKAYAHATELLEKGAYLKAREAFQSLNDYSDASEKADECLYRRALSVLSFCENYNVRHIYLAIGKDLKDVTKVSMPGQVLTELGSDIIFELKKCFLEDGVEFCYEDTPSGEGYLPICEAVQNEFEKLGEYKNSADLKIRASEVGDFTRPFYQLLHSGELNEATKWLKKYGDEIPDSGAYIEWLEYLQMLCSKWQLSMGDSTLIPFSVGLYGTKLENLKTRITIDNNVAALHITQIDDEYEVTLSANFGQKQFSSDTDGSVYYGYLNQVDHLVYIRYSQNGSILSSCEYNRE